MSEPMLSGEPPVGAGMAPKSRGADLTAIFRPGDLFSTLQKDALGHLEGFAGWGLLVERGPQAGRTYSLEEGITQVGRHLKSRILLDDITVSRWHCRLTVEGDLVTVEDEGSTNGTYVNGARMESSRLHPGDRLMVGRFHLVVVRGND
ncbi:MAG: FHA domain-containing protein [Actinomycetia bacterium]|nr:FHA domain-containing protein [Actinomycetes bacterium]